MFLQKYSYKYLYSIENQLAFEVEVSLFQEGFPLDTDSEYKSSPLVADLDGDGDNELVTADGFGVIRVYSDGSEINNDHFRIRHKFFIYKNKSIIIYSLMWIKIKTPLINKVIIIINSSTYTQLI